MVKVKSKKGLKRGGDRLMYRYTHTPRMYLVYKGAAIRRQHSFHLYIKTRFAIPPHPHTTPLPCYLGTTTNPRTTDAKSFFLWHRTTVLARLLLVVHAIRNSLRHRGMEKKHLGVVPRVGATIRAIPCVASKHGALPTWWMYWHQGVPFRLGSTTPT